MTVESNERELGRIYSEYAKAKRANEIAHTGPSEYSLNYAELQWLMAAQTAGEVQITHLGGLEAIQTRIAELQPLVESQGAAVAASL